MKAVANGAARRLAAQHDLPVLVGAADYLPVEELSATCPARSAPVHPGITNRGAVFAQDKGSYDPAKGRSSTRTRSSRCRAFNYYFGKATASRRASAASGTSNQDLSFIKNTRMGGGTNLQIRFEMFNMWNWHIFGARGTTFNDTTAGFDLDLASPTFGEWKGTVSNPRNMQLAGPVRNSDLADGVELPQLPAAVSC